MRKKAPDGRLELKMKVVGEKAPDGYIGAEMKES